MTAIYLSLKNINAEVVVGGQQQQETSHLIFLCACSTTFTTFTGGNKISQDKNTKSSNLKMVIDILAINFSFLKGLIA